MKRIFFFGLAVILVLAIALSCCGGDNDGGTGPTTFSITESLVPATSETQFPTGIDDEDGYCKDVTYHFYIAKYDVTYALWKEVYDWATDSTRGSNQYTFDNPGRPGGCCNGKGEEISLDHGHETDPVTCIDWRDAVVWCNALTEYYNEKTGNNLDGVYKNYDGNVLRNSKEDGTKTYFDSMADFDSNAKGFRLPTSMEWELAARYRGNDSTNAVLVNGTYYTKGNSASGATAAYTDAAATGMAAWYKDNSKVSSDPDIYSTRPVGKKPINGNTLGLYDMSGNVWTWCFDRFALFRIIRGSRWFDDASLQQLGFKYNVFPDVTSNYIGFRTARTE